MLGVCTWGGGNLWGRRWWGRVGMAMKLKTFADELYRVRYAAPGQPRMGALLRQGYAGQTTDTKVGRGGAPIMKGHDASTTDSGICGERADGVV